MEILEEKLGDKVKEYRREIDIITRNASRLQNLAESILQVSRIESGTFSISVQGNIDIHPLIAQVIEDVEKKYAYTDKAGKVSIVFLPLYEKERVEKTAKSMDMSMGGIDDGNKSGDNSTTPTPPKQASQRENVQETSESTQNDNNDKYNNYNNTARPLYVDCDSQKIAQVIFNLLDNAMKFTFDGKIYVSTTITDDEHPQLAPSSSPPPDSASDIVSASNDHYDASLLNTNTVDVASAATGASKTSINSYTNANGNNNGNGNVYGQTNSSSSKVLVTVRDTGTGINSQIKDQLFEKFATKSRQGTGLGLYLSKKIIESHGGNIWYEKPGEESNTDIDNASNKGDSIKTGTVFKFSIPMTISKNKSIENKK
jgi:signal transduction histidine kinase